MSLKNIIGENPDQVPVRGDLGTMAFQDHKSVNIEGGKATLDYLNIKSGDLTVDSLHLKNLELDGGQSTFFINSYVTRTFLYDTTKDSDGGAWRKRCSHTTWYKEPLSGPWLGAASNEAAARGLKGAVTGAYYYNTTDSTFYTLNATSGQTETTRGNKAAFPETVLITISGSSDVSGGRVIIWDVTDPLVPMWMVFKNVSVGTDIATSGALTLASGSSYPFCVYAYNGSIYVGSSGSGTSVMGINDINFIRDTSRWYSNYSTTKGRNIPSGLAYRNTLTSTTVETGWALIDSTTLSVIATALPDARIDASTGLPAATVLAGTLGGLTQINEDLSTFNFSFATYPAVSSVGFASNGFITFTGQSNTYSPYGTYVEMPVLTASLTGQTSVAAPGYIYRSTTVPKISRASNSYRATHHGNKVVIKHSNVVPDDGVTILAPDRATPTNGMVAVITTRYNSGWMPGDCTGAWMCDTTSGNLVSTNLITGDSSTFTNGMGSWSNDTKGNGLVAATGGVLTLTADSARLTITNAVGDGTNVTYTTSTNHGYSVGQIVSISGITPTTFNSTWSTGKTITAITANTFTIASTVTDAYTSGGFCSRAAFSILTVPVVQGKSYKLSLTVGGSPGTYTVGAGGMYYYNGTPPAGLKEVPLPNMMGDTLTIQLFTTAATQYAGEQFTVDNVVLEETALDASLNVNCMPVVGTLTRSPVNTDSQLTAYSGFTTANYLELPFQTVFDYAGDFQYMGWYKAPNLTGTPTILGRGTTAVFGLRASSGALQVTGSAGIINVGKTITANVWEHIIVGRKNGVLFAYANGVKTSLSTAYATSFADAGLGPLTLGANPAHTGNWSGSLAMWKTSAYAVSDEQAAMIYETERKLFGVGAQCTLDGATSTNAIAYTCPVNSDTDEFYLGTAWGTSVFKDLIRVRSEAVTGYGTQVRDISSTGRFTAMIGTAGGKLTALSSSITPQTQVKNPAVMDKELLQRFQGRARTMGTKGNSLVREWSYANAATTGLIEYGLSHNCDLIGGVWQGRDLADACWLEKWSVTGTKEVWFAPSAAAGTVPVWTCISSSDINNVSNTNISEKNLIANGNFDIWQKGPGPFTDWTSNATYASGDYGYTADRWCAYRGGNVAGLTASRVTGMTYDSTYSLKIQRTAGNTSVNVMHLDYNFSTSEITGLRGKQITLSLDLKAGADFSAAAGIVSLAVYYGTGANGRQASGFTGGTQEILPVYLTNGASVARFATPFTLTVPTNATQMCIKVSYAPVGTAGADDSITVGRVQLEVGKAATQFEVANKTATLLKCMRFYQSWDSTAGVTNYTAPPVAAGGYQAATTSDIRFLPTVPMDKAPTVTKVGTWTVTNCGQPTITAPSGNYVSVNTVVTALGAFSYTSPAAGLAYTLDSRVI